MRTHATFHTPEYLPLTSAPKTVILNWLSSKLCINNSHQSLYIALFTSKHSQILHKDKVLDFCIKSLQSTAILLKTTDKESYITLTHLCSCTSRAVKQSGGLGINIIKVMWRQIEVWLDCITPTTSDGQYSCCCYLDFYPILSRKVCIIFFNDV